MAAASIGPVTSRTARSFGIEVAAEASEYTTDGLVTVIGESSPLRREL